MTRPNRSYLFATMAGLALAACGELPQDGPKPFVSAEEQRSMQPTIERAHTQDEYRRTGRTR